MATMAATRLTVRAPTSNAEEENTDETHLFHTTFGDDHIHLN